MNFQKKLFIKLMKQFKKNIYIIDEEYNKAEGIFTVEWYCETMHIQTSLIITLFSQLFNIHEEALSWFVWENDFGAKKLTVDDAIINSISKFWDSEKK